MKEDVPITELESNVMKRAWENTELKGKVRSLEMLNQHIL